MTINETIQKDNSSAHRCNHWKLEEKKINQSTSNNTELHISIYTLRQCTKFTREPCCHFKRDGKQRGI